MILVFMGGKSQNDSTPKLKFSGVQVDLHGVTNFGGFKLDRQQIMKYVSDDPLSQINYGGYSSWSNGTTIDFNGTVGFKVYGTFSKKRRYERDVYLGMYYGGSCSSTANYFQQAFETVDSFSNSSGKKIYQIKETENIYFYNLSSKQVIIPMGITINTNKQKRIWASVGISAAPGIRTNYRYNSNNFLITSTYLSAPTNGSYYSIGPRETSTELLSQYSKKIKQVGFVGYVSIPASVSLRMSKKIKVLKHMNANMSIAPAYYLSFDKINKLNQGFAMVTNLGFRYNL